MDVLNLATKEKQDEILAKPSGTDFFEGVPVCQNIRSDTRTLEEVLSVSGKGLLNTVNMFMRNSGGEGFLEITVDGEVMHSDDISVVVYGRPYTHVMLIPFESSLEIKVRSTSRDVDTSVTCLLFE